MPYLDGQCLSLVPGNSRRERIWAGLYQAFGDQLAHKGCVLTVGTALLQQLPVRGRIEVRFGLGRVVPAGEVAEQVEQPGSLLLRRPRVTLKPRERLTRILRECVNLRQPLSRQRYRPRLAIEATLLALARVVQEHAVGDNHVAELGVYGLSGGDAAHGDALGFEP